MIIKKIPLKALMDILQDAWERGADYVDIIGNTADVQHNVMVAIREEYMSEEEEENAPNEEKPSDDELTDDQLNLLL